MGRAPPAEQPNGTRRCSAKAWDKACAGQADIGLDVRLLRDSLEHCRQSLAAADARGLQAVAAFAAVELTCQASEHPSSVAPTGWPSEMPERCTLVALAIVAAMPMILGGTPVTPTTPTGPADAGRVRPVPGWSLQPTLLKRGRVDPQAGHGLLREGDPVNIYPFIDAEKAGNRQRRASL